MTEANTLSGFMRAYLSSHKLSNRSFSRKAEVSESAVRNILKWGHDDKARDPDPGTLIKIAKAMKINPIILFELAGYLKERSSDNSPYAKYLADVFDGAKPDVQEAIVEGFNAIVRNRYDL
jgi:hypothetical protein